MIKSSPVSNAATGRVCKAGMTSAVATLGRVMCCAWLFAFMLSLHAAAQTDVETVNRTLALDLVNEGDYDGAAIEFRRLSLMADDSAARDGYRWLSAYYYLEEQQPEVAVKMLDAVEGRDAAWKHDLLRAAVAGQTGNTGEQMFYLRSLLDRDDLSAEERDYAARQLAALLVREGRLDEADAVLRASARAPASALEALRHYEDGRDKSPALGGWLGLIPGLGYAYAGEYANMVRSIILNGLFIYGMIDTAGDEEWGAFAVITFFEITWYTGSIYGGIDASHRYNARRKQSLLDAVSAGIVMEPDEGQVPVISLRFRF